QLFTGVIMTTEIAWSPDSKWIAYVATDDNFFSNVFVAHVDESEPKQATFLSNIGCGNVLWAKNGKFLIFETGQYRSEDQIARVDLQPIPPVFKEDDFEKLFEDEKKDDEKDEKKDEKPESKNGDGADESVADEEKDRDDSEKESTNGDEKKDDKKKDKEPEPVKIDFENIRHRVRFLTDAKLGALPQCIRPDSKTLVFRAAMTGQPNLWSLSLEEDKRNDPPKQLTTGSNGVGSAEFSPDGKRLYYLEGGRILSIGMDDTGARDGDPKALDTRAEVEIDFHAEKMQSFDEAWRLMRDHFYDADYHGCDWNAVRDSIRPMVDAATTNTDYRELMNLMVGELNASHLGAGGGGSSAPDAFLGVEFDRAELEAGRFKIAYVIPESPVTVPAEPTRVGEYLLSVDGVALSTDTDLAKLLQRKTGKRVALTLADAPDASTRTITVKPVHIGALNNLRYDDWKRWNANYVVEKSGGRLGYVHVRAMAYEYYLQFIADLDSQSHQREGILVDVRFNGGGHIAPFILDVLARRGYTRSSLRGRALTVDTNLAGNRILEKPVILLANEHSGSNAEMFTEGFRRLGLGKVVGQPTAGAVIWTWGWGLLDGTSFRLPRMKVATLDGENLEGNARPVDIEVERPLGEAAQGRESQLDAAIDALIQQIDGE
ncbi:MAG: S41 family peptidase, partial [Candidatus Poribacteria bacterium]|nr:S41 family peptidase [Candidatus Poribacteria bacterium]